MLSMFAGALTSTLSGLAVAMQAYADKQEEPAALHGGKLGLVTLRQCVAPSVHGGQHYPVLPGKGCLLYTS